MKKTLFLLALGIFNQSAFAETIILESNKWCPFACEPTASGSKNPGYIIEVAKIIFERKGHNIDYKIDTWGNSINHVRNGSATGLVATTIPEASDFIYPSVNMGNNKECFYVNTKDSWEFLGLDNLKTRKLGIADTQTYSPALMSYLRDHSDRTVKSYGDNPLLTSIENLNNKKIDTIIENPFVFNYLTESKKIREQYVEAGCTDGESLYIGFSPKNPRSKEFAKILTDGIEDLRKDGTLGKIITKYSIKDWSP